MSEYYWIEEFARYSPSQNKNNPWSVHYISSKCEGVKYFKTYLDAWRFIQETPVDECEAPF